MDMNNENFNHAVVQRLSLGLNGQKEPTEKEDKQLITKVRDLSDFLTEVKNGIYGPEITENSILFEIVNCGLYLEGIAQDFAINVQTTDSDIYISLSEQENDQFTGRMQNLYSNINSWLELVRNNLIEDEENKAPSSSLAIHLNLKETKIENLTERIDQENIKEIVLKIIQLRNKIKEGFAIIENCLIGKTYINDTTQLIDTVINLYVEIIEETPSNMMPTLEKDFYSNRRYL